jgi:hypothetical protein
MGKWSEDPVWGTILGDSADNDVTLKFADNGEWLAANGHLESSDGGMGDIQPDVPHAHLGEDNTIFHDVSDDPKGRYPGQPDVFGWNTGTEPEKTKDLRMNKPLPDLNRLRQIIHEQQAKNEPYPVAAEKQISVTRDGSIQIGARIGGAPTSKVQQGTFAVQGPKWFGLGMTREEQDQQTAAEKLPVNTRFVDTEDARGWCYEHLTEFGNSYTFFAYFTGSNYQVRLLEPALESQYNPHNVRLFRDGRICLSGESGSGQPSLEEAYSKSVLWSLGIDLYKQTGSFPFSINNLND